MTKNELLEKFETKLGTELHKVMPLNRIDGFLDKFSKENETDFDINEYIKKIGIKKYDFKRPDKFSRDQIRTISMIYETFARLTTAGLSANLRTYCIVRVSNVDQMTYEEFIRSLPDPTTLAVVDMTPLKACAVLEIDPSLTNAIIEKLLGGKGNINEVKINREITEIEASIVESVIIKMLGNLRHAWSNVIDLQPRLGSLEVNPMFTQVVPPSDMVVTISLETKIGNVKGFMNICLPYITIEPIIYKLSGQYWYSAIRKKNIGNNIKDEIGNIKLPVKIGIKTDEMPVKTLFNLKKGDLVPITEYIKGEYVMYSGKPVMKLSYDSLKKNRIEFKVASDEKTTDWKQNGNAPEYNIEEAMKKPLDEMVSGFSNTVNKLNDRIGVISKKQDEIFDALGFISGNGRIENPISVNSPFEIITEYNIEDFVAFFKYEHPQTIAMIISYLKPSLGNSILSLIQDELKIDVIKRLAGIQPVPPDIIKDIEKILTKKLQSKDNFNIQQESGINTIVEILNLTSRSTERFIIDNLQKENPDLAEEIKKRMFVFEDIVLLSDKAIKKIIESIDKDDLVLSIKSINREVKEKIYTNLKKAEIEEIEKVLSEIGPIKLTKIEECQQRIVLVIRKLESLGEISIARTDEEVI